MSLDLAKLELKRDLPGGVVQARCPACAESGGDRKGEHLRVYPDGRFGCCVHPKDGEHRKRIFALAGCRKPRAFSVRVAKLPNAAGCQSVKAALAGERVGTLGTAKSGLVAACPSSANGGELDLPGFGTLGTVNLKLRACARGDTPNSIEELKDSETAVPSVLLAVLPDGHQSPEKLPYLTAAGTLVIPFDSPERYHWWKPDGERLTVTQIRRELEHAKSNIKSKE